MLDPRKTLLAAAGLAALAAGTSGATATDAQHGLRCEILVERSGGMIAVAPTVASDEAISGAYRLTLAGASASGRTSIRQGGPFTAQAGETVRLSRAMVSASAATDAELEIDAGGETVACARRIAP